MRAARLAALLCATLVAPCAVLAQRIAVLGPDEQPRFSDIVSGLKRGLRDQGYAESALEIVETRVARGEQAKAKAIIESLAAQRVAALFVIGSSLARLARESAPALPIVFITPGDPVAAGMLSSLARPGRRMTALTFEYPELSAKRLELLRDLAPGIRRVLVLYDPRDSSPRQGAEAARAAATALGMTLVEVPVRNAREISAGLQRLDDADALLGVPGGATTPHYRQIIAAAHAKRRASIMFTDSPETREALLSYGASDIEVSRQAARALASILRGADAGELPVERPAKLTLVVNLRTAKLLGITVPPALALRADRLIE